MAALADIDIAWTLLDKNLGQPVAAEDGEGHPSDTWLCAVAEGTMETYANSILQIPSISEAAAEQLTTDIGNISTTCTYTTLNMRLNQNWTTYLYDLMLTSCTVTFADMVLARWLCLVGICSHLMQAICVTCWLPWIRALPPRFRLLNSSWRLMRNSELRFL